MKTQQYQRLIVLCSLARWLSGELRLAGQTRLSRMAEQLEAELASLTGAKGDDAA